jgi:hypothetical protein
MSDWGEALLRRQGALLLPSSLHSFEHFQTLAPQALQRTDRSSADQPIEQQAPVLPDARLCGRRAAFSLARQSLQSPGIGRARDLGAQLCGNRFIGGGYG